MYVDITNAELSKPLLYLCKPNREILFNLHEAYEIKHSIKLGQIGELSFSLPYQIDVDHELTDVPYIPYIKHRYLIKYIFNDFIEWFMINIPTDTANDDSDVKSVECYSLGYELNDKIIKVYDKTSLNATQVLTDVLSGTIWSIGFVDAKFDLMYRSFEVNSTTVLDMVFQIAITFGGIIQWDTIKRTISLHDYDTIGINKGLVFDYGQYTSSLDYTIDPDEFCTRAIITGKDEAVINSVNPTGLGWIDNFTYFLYPFTRDVNKVVLTHSDYMSDSLCNALLDYEELILSKQTEFSTLLSQLSALQGSLIIKESDLVDLNEELIEIQDELDIAQSTGGSTTTLNAQKSEKQSEINNKQSEIDALKSSISLVNTQIATLRNLISSENNFTSEQIIELNQFVIEKEINNEYISDPEQLLVWGTKQLLKIVEPIIEIDINVVNFLQCLDPECVADSVKLSLSGGDIVTVKYAKFSIDIQATITEINLDYENEDISLKISNIKTVNKDEQKFLERINKSVSTSISVVNKHVTSTANEVQNLLENIWDSTSQSLNASVNNTVTINRQGIIVTDPTDPANIVRISNGIIGLSTDGSLHFKNAITPWGVIKDNIIYSIIKCGD